MSDTSDTLMVNTEVASLLGQLLEAQAQLELTNAQIAKKTGLNRMTIQRLSDEGADPQLSSFVAVSAAVGLRVVLASGSEILDSTPEDKIVHKGLCQARLKGDKQWESTKRECALAAAWESANTRHLHWAPTMHHLVPGHTQAQATAAATVIQWLGSDVGFDFLKAALDTAGYEIVQKKKGK